MTELRSRRNQLILIVVALLAVLLLLGFWLQNSFSARISDLEKSQNAQQQEFSTELGDVKNKINSVTVDDREVGGDVAVVGGGDTTTNQNRTNTTQNDSTNVSSDVGSSQNGARGENGANGTSGTNGSDGAAGQTGPQGPSGIASCPNGNCLSLQGSSPGSQEVGGVNISGDGQFGGTVSAGSFSGDGANVTNVDATTLAGQNSSYYQNANNINSGTLSDGQLSSNVTLQGNTFNGASQLVQLSSGGILPMLDGSQLTNVLAANAMQLGGQAAAYYLNASNLNAGTLSDSLLSTNVTLQGNTFNGANQLVKLASGGGLPILDGSQLTNVDAQTLNGQLAAYYLNASNINGGTLADARLSANVALKNVTNTFTGTNNFAGVTATGILQNGYSVCSADNNCNYAAASGGAGYIQNGTVQQTANLNISGNGYFGGNIRVGGATTNYGVLDITGGTAFNSSGQLKIGGIHTGFGGDALEIRSHGGGATPWGDPTIVLTDGTGSFGSRLNFAQSTNSNVVGYVGYSGSGLTLSNSSSTMPLQIKNTDAQPISLITSNAERVRIQANGNASFGSAADLGQLSVVNDVASDAGLVVQGATSQSGDLLRLQDSAASSLFSVAGSGSVGIGMSPNPTKGLVSIGGANDAVPRLALYSDSSSTEFAKIGFYNHSGAIDRGNIGYQSSYGLGMFVQGNNFLGVDSGTGEAKISSVDPVLNFKDASSTVNGTINFGSGTTNGAQLNYTSASGGELALRTFDTFGGNILLDNQSQGKSVIIKTTPTGGSATERLRVDSTGNVGIGESSPGARLHVKNSTASTIGQIIQGVAGQTADLLQVQNLAGTVLSKIDASGNLTVKSADIQGDYISFSNNIRGYNTSVTAATTTKVVTFGTAHPDANYAVLCTPNWNTTCFVSGKTTTGFTLNFGTAAPAGQLVDWFVAR